MKKIILLLFVLFTGRQTFSQGFTFTVTPTIQTVGNTDSIAFDINVNIFGGYSSSIFFSVITSNCVSSYFTVQHPALNAPYSNQQLKFHGDNTADVGYYQVIVKGENGAYSFQDTCYINIVPSSPDIWTIYDDTNSGLTNSTVYNMKADANGNIWAAVRSGYGPPNGCLAKYTGQDWEVWTVNNHYMVDNCNNITPVNTVSPVTSDGVWAVEVDNTSDNVWIGTANGTIHRYKVSTSTWTNFSFTGLNTVFDLEADNLGHLWIASSSGLHYYDGSTLTNYNSSNSPLTSNPVVNSLMIDNNNILWAATQNSGVLKYDGNFWTVYNSSTSIIPDATMGIYQDDTGNIWLGGGSFNSGDKIYRYSGGNWTAITAPIANFVTYDFIRFNNKLFIGTYQGMFEYDITNNSFTQYTCTTSQLPCDHYMHYDNIVTSFVKRPSDNALVIGLNGGGMVIARGAVTPPVVGMGSSEREEQLFDVYPNPGKGLFTIATKINKAGTTNIQVTDLLGKTVFQESYHTDSGENKRALEINGKGLYFIRIQTSDGSISTQKIIVE